MERQTYTIKAKNKTCSREEELEDNEDFQQADFETKIKMIVRHMQPPKSKKAYGQFEIITPLLQDSNLEAARLLINCNASLDNNPNP